MKNEIKSRAGVKAMYKGESIFIEIFIVGMA